MSSTADDVREQLSEDYPDEATAWVADAQWDGPKAVPLVDLDFSNEKHWRATAEPEKIHKFAKKIEKGKLKPIIAVKTPGSDKLVIVDGHHRALAYRALGRPATAYVGKVSAHEGPWQEMHSSQTHGPSTFSALCAVDAILLSISKESSTTAEHVNSQLRHDYPPESLAWIHSVKWSGPDSVELSVIDFSNESEWQAANDPARIEKVERKIARGKLKPIVLTEAPDHSKMRVIDGHHRALVYRKLGKPALAYVAHVPSKDGPWDAVAAKDLNDNAAGMSATSDAQQLDMAISDVHTKTAIGNSKPMAKTELISAAKRHSLPASKFGDPANEAYPIHDAAHVRNAAARLEHQKSSMSPAKYSRIRARIARAAKKIGVDSEYNKKKKTSARTFSRGLRMTTTHPDGTRTTIHHMSAYCSEEGDKLWLAIPFDKSSALAEGDENKRVWVQIARAGKWLGHRQGAFVLNSQIFDQLCANFESQKVGRLQYDFEHASEQPPSQGMIPAIGAPAQGWIYALKHDGQKLFALTEWGSLARQYIENDQYSGVSPAINWNQKDRESGRPIGAVLSSVALTNKPYLTQMQPLAASALILEEEAQQELRGIGCCYSASEYLPRIKSALRLHELATPQEMADHLDKLREHMDAAGGDHTQVVNGVNLSDYALPLRQLVNAHAGMDWDEVFDVVENLIDAAMEKHVVEMHPEEAAVESSMNSVAEIPPTPPIANSTSAEATPAASTLTSQGGPQMAKSTEEYELEIKNLTGERNQLKVDLEAAVAVNSELSAKVEAHELQLLTSEVDASYETYQKKMGLTPDMKQVMLGVAQKQGIDALHRLYPKLPQPQRHLLNVLTGDGRTAQTTQLRVQADNANDITPVLKPAELVSKIMKETNCSLLDAQCRVDAMLTKMQRRAG
jgi:hypothetical protein